jgi:DNA-binding NarL/FixJ family response regulator
VVVVSAEDDPNLIHRAIEAGAVGFIPKTTDQSVIINALRLVMAHGVYLPPSALAHGPSDASDRRGAQVIAMPTLSERQRGVLRLLLRGKSNKLIARELNLAEGTVKAHLWSVYQLLGVSTRVQAMYRVYELGMLSSLSDAQAVDP